MTWLVLAIHPHRPTVRLECFTYLARGIAEGRYREAGYAVTVLPRLR